MIEDAALSRAGLAFGPFLLVPDQQMLLRRGERVRLGSRALDILILLVRRRGELVTKNEIVAHVWPDLVVEENNLRVHMVALRRALGDDPRNPTYIHNVTGRGYRFLAPIAEVAAPEPSIAAILEGAPSAAPLAQNADDAPSTAPVPDAAPTERRPASAATLAQLPGTPTREGPMPARQTIGRDDTVEGVAERLLQRRFLTIVGPGGIGKTTVALGVVDRLRAQFPEPPLLLWLASLQDPAHVATALASALRVELPPAGALDALAFLLQHRRVLIVLDNCEHLIEAAALLAEHLIAAVPSLHVLATSREPLRAEGEWVFRLPPLACPDEADGLTAADALAYPAVALFVQRATASNDSFAFRDADVPAVIEICRQLDGIPLALELAASRVGLFPVADLATRLGDRFDLLTKGRRSALPRHQTLRATMDWSHELLTPDERVVLRRLSVFRGAFGLDAALAVAVDGGVSRPAVFDAISSLAAKSLITVDPGPHAARYRLLETTRAYAAEKLGEAQEIAEIAARHARDCCDFLATAESDWETHPRADWHDAFAWRIDDVRAALEWAFSTNGDLGLGIQLVERSTPLWFALSLLSEYRIHLERGIAALDSVDATPHLHMRLDVVLAAVLFNTAGPTAEMAAASARALAQAEALGEPSYQLRALWGICRERYASGDYPAALDRVEAFGRVAAQVGDESAMLIYERMISLALHLVGEHARARDFAARAIAHPAGEIRSTHKGLYEYDHHVAVRSHYARILWIQGAADQALAMAADGVQRAIALGTDTPLCAMLATSACPLAFWVGDSQALAGYLGLLVDRAGRLLSTHWRSFARSYEQAAALREATEDETAETLRSALLGVSLGPLHADFLATLDERLAGPVAIARAEAGLAPWSAPEVIRAQGANLLAAHGAAAAARAEALFEQARALARRQGALAWELRVALDLGALWRDRGEASRGHDLVAEVHQRFTEGFGTRDLRRAAAFLVP